MKNLFFLLIVMFLLTGCSQNNEMKVGLAITLTNSEGISSEYGIAVRNGFMMAIDEINEKGGINGKKLVPVIRDDNDSIDRAKEIVDEFNNLGIDIVFGFSTSKMYPAVEYANDNYDMLFITATMSTPNIANLDDNLVRVVPADNLHVNVLGNIASEHLKLKTLGIIYDGTNLNYTEPFKEIFKEHYTGKTVFEDDSLDPTIILGLVETHQPEGLLFITSSDHVIEIKQQLNKHNFSPATLISGWATTPDLFTFGGQTIEGIYCVQLFDENSIHKGYVSFKEAFKGKYNSIVSRPALLTYEGMMMFYEASTQLDEITPANVKSKIIDIGTFTGLQEIFTINEYGDTERHFYRMVIKDKTYQSIE